MLLVGATGLVGKALLHELLKEPRIAKVTSLVRRPSGITDARLDERVISFDALGSLELPEVDDAYCALGTTIKVAGSEEAFRLVDFTYPMEIAKKVKAAGAKRFLLVSAIGASRKSSVFYSRTKGECEHAIKELAFDATFLFRPSLLLGEREEKRAGEGVGKALATVLGPLLLGPLKQYRAISGETVARAMVRAAFSDRVGVQMLRSDEIAALGV